ncbi:MAG: hypothetical protein WD768_19185 [Phycisphaeraceae bacterium]
MQNESNAFREDFEPGCLTQGLLTCVAIVFACYGFVGLINGRVTVPSKHSSMTIEGNGAPFASTGLFFVSLAFVSATMSGEHRKGCLTVGVISFVIGVALIIVGAEVSRHS